MRTTIALVALALLTITGNAQTTTTYYDENGMPIGKAKTEQTQTQQPYQGSTFNYKSSLPSLDLIERGMAYKQGQTDSRKAAMQTMIDGIAADINRLFSDYPNEGRRQYQGLNDLINRLNNTQQDITQDNVYNPMVSMANDFKRNVYRAYKEIAQGTSQTAGKAGRTTEKATTPTWEYVTSLVKDKKYSDAIDQLNTLIASVADNEPYLEYRAWIYSYRIRNFEKAIQDYTTCIQMRPDSSKLYYQRGVILERTKQYIEAVKDLTTCIQYDNHNLDAYFSRAVCKSSLGDYQGECNDYDVIISKVEADNQLRHEFIMATVYNNKGYSLFKSGKTNEALVWVNKALETGMNEAYIWSSRGEIYFNQGKYKEAISDFDKSIELFEAKKSHAPNLSGNDGLEYYLRGLSKIKIGNRDGGCKDLSKAGELGKEEAYRAIKEKCH